MKHNILFLIVTLPFAVVSGVNERSHANRLLSHYFDEFGNTEQVLNNPPFDIQDRTRVCGLCHGEDGNSVRENIPTLAGQNPAYFLEQMLVFKQGDRYPNMMHEMAREMDENTMVTIAVYYSSLPRKLNATLAYQPDGQGKELYSTFCIHCHGEWATGANDTYANIRAQRPDYLITTIKRFRDGVKKRKSHVMGAAVKEMSDEEIRALANYIAGL